MWKELCHHMSCESWVSLHKGHQPIRPLYSSWWHPMFFLREFSLLHSYGNNIDSNNSNNTTTSCSPITEMSAWVYTSPLGTVSVRTDSVVSACMVFAEETDVCSFTRNRIWRQVLLESHQKHCKQINRHIKISKTHPEGSDAKTNRDWQLIDQYQYERMRLRERLEFNHVLKQLGYIFIFKKHKLCSYTPTLHFCDVWIQYVYTPHKLLSHF